VDAVDRLHAVWTKGGGGEQQQHRAASFSTVFVTAHHIHHWVMATHVAHLLQPHMGTAGPGTPAPLTCSRAPPPQNKGPSPQRLQASDLRDPLHTGRVCPHAWQGGGLEAASSQGAQAALRLRSTRLLELTRPVYVAQ
jgi:hypothetical protein